MRSQRQRTYSASTNKKIIYQTVFKYMLYGWGIPILIVTTCVMIEFSCEYIIIGYKQQQDCNNPCWISNPLSNLVAFGIPLFLILLLNSYFFVSSARAIKKSSNISKHKGSPKGVTRTVNSMFVKVLYNCKSKNLSYKISNN